MKSSTERPHGPPLTAEHYRQYRTQIAAKGITKRAHATSIKNAIRSLKVRLKKFCEYIDEDPLTFLTRGEKEDIITFLKWLHDNSRITKVSTSQEYKRVYFMLYRRSIGRSLHAKIAQEIDDYINVDLKRLYNLDTSMAEKPVMNVDDIYLILYYHWVTDTVTFPDGRQRLQIDFLELLIAGTAIRPGLVYVRLNEKRIKGHCIGEDDSEEEETEEEEKDKYGHSRINNRDRGDSNWEDEDDKTLYYKDVTLLLLPNPGGIRDLLAMEVDIGHTKGHLKKRKRYISYPLFLYTP